VPGDTLGLGRDLLRSGDYARASNAFRDYLQRRATSKYTISVGLFCDLSNAVQAAQAAAPPGNLMVLAVQHDGQPCYRAYWGLYDTGLAAEQGMSSLPATLRAFGQAPISVSQLFR
jgi:hypothetical protein